MIPPKRRTTPWEGDDDATTPVQYTATYQRERNGEPILIAEYQSRWRQSVDSTDMRFGRYLYPDPYLLKAVAARLAWLEARETERREVYARDQTNQDRVVRMHDTILGLNRELSDLQATFDLRHKADTRAIAAWRDGHPERDLTLPDHADLCGWLMERVKLLEGQVKTFRFALGDLVTEAENLADTDGCSCEGERCQTCLTMDAVKRGYELLEHKNVDRDIYGDDLADARAERDQYEHDRDATAGELATVREEIADGLRVVLLDHWPMVVCNHEAKSDHVVCSCSRVTLPECPNVGSALATWIEHVLECARPWLAAPSTTEGEQT